MGKTPVTAAIRALRRAGIDAGTHPYRYDGGGARGAAEALGIPEQAVVKTLVFLADGEPVLVLMHGDHEVSTRAVGRALGAKRVEPAPVDVAERVTGYRVGGISPFGTRRDLTVVCQATVLDLELVHVNGGRRGLLVSIDPTVFVDLLDPVVADVAS
jgi:Cys-tRNA(Pro) deacylase